MFKHIAAATAILIASSSAFAAQPGSFYAGADVGKTRIDGISGRGTSIGAFLGYNFHENFAFEAGYRRLASLDFTAGSVSGDIDLNQAAVSLVGTLPLNNGFNLFGRLGYNRIEVDSKVRGFGGAKESESNALAGVGIGYAFSPAVSARLEWQKPASDASNLSVGVAFAF